MQNRASLRHGEERREGDILGIPRGHFPRSFYKPNPWKKGSAKKQLLPSDWHTIDKKRFT